jgi:hypothetical protein
VVVFRNSAVFENAPLVFILSIYYGNIKSFFDAIGVAIGANFSDDTVLNGTI